MNRSVFVSDESATKFCAVGAISRSIIELSGRDNEGLLAINAGIRAGAFSAMCDVVHGAIHEFNDSSKSAAPVIAKFEEAILSLDGKR